MAAGKQLVVPNCVVAGAEPPRTYDLNSWQETKESREVLLILGPDDVTFEGYNERPTFRKHIGSLAGQGDLVDLDGIGGSAILVRGDLHRRGLNFPSFAVEHALETEGMAKMAKKMGVQPYGMPNIAVQHK